MRGLLEPIKRIAKKQEPLPIYSIYDHQWSVVCIANIVYGNLKSENKF